MGHSGRGRGALPAQSRVAGLAGRQRPAAPVSASAHRNAGAKLARRTLQPCHAAPAGTVAYAEGIPSPLFGSQTPATAARAGGTAPAGRSGDDSEHARQRGIEFAAAPRGDSAVRAGGSGTRLLAALGR